MRIIAAMDIIDGKCVRLTHGDFTTKREYSASPLETAKKFEDSGIRFLHMVDLDGARSGRPVNMKVLEQVVSGTSMSVDFGGGIRSISDLQRVFSCGAAGVTAGSIAVTEPNMFMYWVSRYGTEKILLSADCRDRIIATHGWQTEEDIDIIGFIRSYADLGILNVICTDITRDGTLTGPATGLYKDILSEVSVNLTASGGIKSTRDLDLLKKAGCSGAIIGKAIYEGLLDLKQLSEYVEEENYTMS